MDGVLNIFKEPGYTSRDVVNILQKKLHQKKIGHAGTLDPDACGVLVACLGKATRISDYLMENRKVYIAEMLVGIQTDTGDISGSILKQSDRMIEKNSLIEELKKYQDLRILQMPPMYSAIKVKGKRLYQYAYQGEKIERDFREVTIYRAQCLHSYKNRFVLRIECSKGTYIRTFLEDLAKNLGSLATMSYLIRTKSGNQSLDQALKLECIEKETIGSYLVPIDQALTLPSLQLDEKYFVQVSNGMKLPISHALDGEYKVYCKEFIGIGEMKQETLHMKKVFVEK